MGNPTSTTFIVNLCLWLFVFTSLTLAHSWVEMLTVIASNGTFTGEPGYPRGNVLRSAPGFGDPLMTNRIPPADRSILLGILPTDLMCMPGQTIGNQTAGSPALKASPGALVSLRYQENGHVTLPQNQIGKPANRGTVFVYGTTQPSNTDTLLGIHGVWTTDGKGGDGRGVLLATRNYDDGQCYQVNSGNISTERQEEFPHTAVNPMGANLWCQTDIALPSSIDGKSYTLYWVWDWPTIPGIDPDLPNGKNETYTTCMDIDISSQSESQKAASDIEFVKGQDLNYAAVESQLANQFQVPASTGDPYQPVTQQTSSSEAETSHAAASATNARGNGPVIVTTTEVIPDMVTIYSTIGPIATPTSPISQGPAAEGSNGSIVFSSPATTSTSSASSFSSTSSASSTSSTSSTSSSSSTSSASSTSTISSTSGLSSTTSTSSPPASNIAAGSPVSVAPFYNNSNNQASTQPTTLAKAPSTTKLAPVVTVSSEVPRPTTLTKAPSTAKPVAVVTVTSEVGVEATATVYEKATSAPKIRGRRVRL